MEKAIILINDLSVDATLDELDVLDQASTVEFALEELGYQTERLFVDLDLAKAADNLHEANPAFVFNLVESLEKDAKLIHLATSLLEHLKIPFTGCRAESMFLTSNKILTKKMLLAAGIAAPKQINPLGNEANPAMQYIAKPIWEDASVGISDENILLGDPSIIDSFLKKHPDRSYFFEEFISGREFNISVLGGSSGPEVLPIPEIVFENYPKDKPQIIGYKAKWDEASFEYHHTNRAFGIEQKEPELAEKLKQICLETWNLFGLKGYARIDLRVDSNGKPWILEINANPCLSEDAGFYAAMQEAGYTFPQVVKQILEDAWN
ncbi:MAG: ATP-grasp domain-containing protein [Bacteroidales bacterium]|nr:ATP-grasp domain-containing protein [Bacteroidales bacterium]